MVTRRNAPIHRRAAYDSVSAHFFDPPAPRSPSFRRSKKESCMAKRAARKAREIAPIFPDFPRDEARAHNLLVVEGGRADDREQRFIKSLRAKGAGQQALVDAIDSYSVVLALGPAGTGKTYLAVAKAVEALEAGKVGRIVLSRPAVEAGESIGYLPGAVEEKLAPYLRPLYDALQDRLSSKRLKALLSDGRIEIAPVGFMRGRTLNNAFIVVDEAQNCTYGQIKMLLTRLGWHSTMVVTGDPMQTDLDPEISGLRQAAQRLEALDNVAIVRLNEADIVRHPLVADMLGVL
jgi:phosphate starvation-inducible PhoH-like protein